LQALEAGHHIAPHRTRRGAVAAHIRSAQIYHPPSAALGLVRRSTRVDHCPHCDGYGDRLRTDGGEGPCLYCHGTGVA